MTVFYILQSQLKGRRNVSQIENCDIPFPNAVRATPEDGEACQVINVRWNLNDQFFFLDTFAFLVKKSFKNMSMS